MKRIILATVLMVFLLVSVSAQSTRGAEALPLWQNEPLQETRRIVVISDLHLGVDDAFSETVANKALLAEFLERIAVSEIHELVIAGDMLDEWFVPVSYPSHSDSGEFYRRVAENNAAIMEAFAKVMQNGIQLIYVPGNHDLLLDGETLSGLLPGIVQSRSSDGMGAYRTGMRSEVVIEHGHRYDSFCSPDPLSNKQITGDYPSFLPPGYFFTRMAATFVAEGKTATQKDLPKVQPPSEENVDQRNAYAYYQIWVWAMSDFPIQAGFDEKVIHCGINGYDNSFSLRDLLPTVQEDGTISAVLYANVQRRWDAVQQINGVVAKNSYAQATSGSIDHVFMDSQAVSQYFDRDPNVDVVVFGHSHVPLVNRFQEGYNRQKVYANSGAWIDKMVGPERCFVLIESDAQSTDVRLMQFNADGTISNAVGK